MNFRLITLWAGSIWRTRELLWWRRRGELLQYADDVATWRRGRDLPGMFSEVYDDSRLTYLQYAPRDKQASNVCATPPKTVCDSVYGMSLGRGSFAFALGGWTRITQTVVLNTPGSPDGSLDLDVNGQRVMSVQGVYYRNAPSASTPQVPAKRQEPTTATATTDSTTTTDTSASMTAAAAAASQAPARWRPPIVVFDAPSSMQAIGFTGLFFRYAALYRRNAETDDDEQHVLWRARARLCDAKGPVHVLRRLCNDC